jgi:hypothetical protein
VKCLDEQPRLGNVAQLRIVEETPFLSPMTSDHLSAATRTRQAAAMLATLATR